MPAHKNVTSLEFCAKYLFFGVVEGTAACVLPTNPPASLPSIIIHEEAGMWRAVNTASALGLLLSYDSYARS